MSDSRRGFSLLEVILAMGILLASTLILTQLLGIGREHSFKSEDVTKAQMLCQVKLSEVLAGIDPLEPVDQQPLENAPGWNYSVEVEPLAMNRLLAVAVTVTENSLPEEGNVRMEHRPRSFRLVRWVRPRPDKELSGAANPATPERHFDELR